MIQPFDSQASAFIGKAVNVPEPHCESLATTAEHCKALPDEQLATVSLHSFLPLVNLAERNPSEPSQSAMPVPTRTGTGGSALLDRNDCLARGAPSEVA